MITPHGNIEETSIIALIRKESMLSKMSLQTTLTCATSAGEQTMSTNRQTMDGIDNGDCHVVALKAPLLAMT